VIDFGGAGCPLGFHSVVVDKRRWDQAGRQVRFSSLENFPNEVDVVFAYHVLEHLPDLHRVVAEIRQKLQPGGFLVAIVPSFSNKNWRTKQHRHKNFGAHVWTFKLSTAPAAMPLNPTRTSTRCFFGRSLCCGPFTWETTPSTVCVGAICRPDETPCSVCSDAAHRWMRGLAGGSGRVRGNASATLGGSVGLPRDFVLLFWPTVRSCEQLLDFFGDDVMAERHQGLARRARSARIGASCPVDVD
jgi:SAM-dependent methyltransferase